MSSIEPILSKHRTNASISIISIIFGVLLESVAILLFVVMDKADPAGRSLIVNTMIGSVIVGLGLILLGWKLRRGDVFALRESGVSVISSGASRDYAFTDIEETCQMYRRGLSVGIAFRKNTQKNWEAASAHLSGYAKFRERFLSGYLAAKVPALMHKISSGQTVQFKITTLSGKAQETFSTGIGQYVSVNTDVISLDRMGITIKGQQVVWPKIVSVDYSVWFENIVLKLTDGTDIPIKTTAMFEPELFSEVIDQILNSEES